MGLSVGNDMKLYHNTGTNASPTWVEMPRVGDVTVDLNLGEAEVDLRESYWLLNLPSKLSGSISVMLANDPGHATVFDVIRGYFFNRTVKQYASANAAIATAGTNYFSAFCFISSFPWAQPTQEMSSHDMTLALAYHEESNVLITPSWNVVPPT